MGQLTAPHPPLRWPSLRGSNWRHAAAWLLMFACGQHNKLVSWPSDRGELVLGG